jgi:Putative Flp pilus-assembly TadE/G-like
MKGDSNGDFSRRACSERGQAFLVIIIFIAVFLLGATGLATDYTQIWTHRQIAQGAADAACQAGAADLYLKALDPAAESTYGLDLSWIGSSFDCSSKPDSAPCRYASLNGYSGSAVAVSFPSTVGGAPSLPPGSGVANPYIKVTITDPVPLVFAKLVSSSGTFNISAKAECGLDPISVPIPLVILHPTANAALSVSGAATIKIFGGPNRSIQVNSTSSTAVVAGTVDLSQAGPGGTGADLAVAGGPSTKPAGVSLGTTGKWITGVIPSGDPWGAIPAPGVPSTAGTATPVPFAVNGCPDPEGCVEFTGGNYTACAPNVAPGGNGCLLSPSFTSAGPAWQAAHAYTAGTLIQPTRNPQHNAGSYIFQAQNSGNSGAVSPNPWNQTIGGNQVDGGVTWKNMGPASTSPATAIFDPGLYYVGAGGLQPDPNTTMRMSTAAGDGTNGATFYFSTSAGTVSVGSNTGKSSACTSASPGMGSPNKCVVSYNPTGGALLGVTSRALQCPGGPANPPQVPSVINGNILFGPCTGTYGAAGGKHRGFLFFQKRSAAANPSWGGGGQFLLSGFMYFHSGSGATCGTNTTCLTMSGGSGAGAFTLGNLVADKLSMSGNSSLNMILNPDLSFDLFRPQVLR